MKKTILLAIAVLMGAALISGCVGNKAQSAEEYAIKPGINETTLVTVDSLPSGASVFLEDKEKPNEQPKRVGVTPITVELPKNKEYVVWLQMTMLEYRVMTKDIPEIQQSLDEFERDEKYDLRMTGDSFFEIYSASHERYETTTVPSMLFAVRIPHEVSTLYELGDRIRVAGIFVPNGMRADVLLPLVGKEETYGYSKEGYDKAMKRHNAPRDLTDRAFNVLTRAGVTLVIFPIESVGNEPPQEMVIRIVAPSPDDPYGLAGWAIHTRTRMG